MSHYLIKLTQVRSLPSIRRFREMHYGKDYKAKEAHIKSINFDKSDYIDYIQKGNEIGAFSFRKNLLYDGDNVIVNKRTEPFIPNIIDYTQYLKVAQYQNSEDIKNLNELWSFAYDNDDLNHPIFNDQELYDIDKMIKKYHINDQLLKFLKNRYHYRPPNIRKNLLSTFISHNITDHSAVGVILTEHRNNLANSINDVISSMHNKLDNSEHFKLIQGHVKNGAKIEELFPLFDFSKVYPYDPLGKWLQNMHDEVKSLPNGDEAIKNWYYIHDYDIQKIIDFVKGKDNHTNQSFHTTVEHLSYIYINGWTKYIETIFGL